MVRIQLILSTTKHICTAATTTISPSATLILPRTTMKTSATLHRPGLTILNFSHFVHISREALHVGQMPFPNPGDVYFSMINVFMESQMHDIEFVLNAGYKTLIYDGNFDIICNHSGILDMIADMQWDGKADYDKVSTDKLKN